MTTCGDPDGLAVGDKVEPVRDGKIVTTLEVTAISSKRAVCDRGDGSVPIAVGDTIRHVTKKPPSPDREAQNVATEPGERPALSLWKLGIRGRIGASYLAIIQRFDGAGGYQQPSLDLRLDGTQVAGAPIDLNLDVRNRSSSTPVPA